MRKSRNVSKQLKGFSAKVMKWGTKKREAVPNHHLYTSLPPITPEVRGTTPQRARSPERRVPGKWSQIYSQSLSVLANQLRIVKAKCYKINSIVLWLEYSIEWSTPSWTLSLVCSRKMMKGSKESKEESNKCSWSNNKNLRSRPRSSIKWEKSTSTRLKPCWSNLCTLLTR